MFTKEKEFVLNELVNDSSLDLNKLKVIDEWYLLGLDEKEKVNQNGKIFDIWNKNINLKNSGFKERIEEIAKYFISCYGAKVKIINYSIANQYFAPQGNNGWDSMWSYQTEIGQLKEESVEWQGSEVTLDQNSSSETINKGCSEGAWKTKKISKADENKLGHIKLPKIRELFVEVNENKNREGSGNLINGKKRTKGIIITELGNVKPHAGKIRLIKVENGKDYWYIDLWFKHKGYELAERINKMAQEELGCQIMDQQDYGSESATDIQKCKGFVKTQFKGIFQKEVNNAGKEEQLCFKGNREFSKDCAYSDDITIEWENLKQELGTKWLEVGQEIGILWQGKSFKWRSF